MLGGRRLSDVRVEDGWATVDVYEKRGGKEHLCIVVRHELKEQAKKLARLVLANMPNWEEGAEISATGGRKGMFSMAFDRPKGDKKTVIVTKSDIRATKQNFEMEVFGETKHERLLWRGVCLNACDKWLEKAMARSQRARRGGRAA